MGLWYGYGMVSFSKIRDMYRLQKQAKGIRKQLKNIHVEAEAPGIKVAVSADMEIISIEVAPEVERDRIAPLLKDALNRAMKKAQLVSSEKMQGVMGELGLGA